MKIAEMMFRRRLAQAQAEYILYDIWMLATLFTLAIYVVFANIVLLIFALGFLAIWFIVNMRLRDTFKDLDLIQTKLLGDDE